MAVMPPLPGWVGRRRWLPGCARDFECGLETEGDGHNDRKEEHPAGNSIPEVRWPEQGLAEDGDVNRSEACHEKCESNAACQSGVIAFRL